MQQSTFSTGSGHSENREIVWLDEQNGERLLRVDKRHAFLFLVVRYRNAVLINLCQKPKQYRDGSKD